MRFPGATTANGGGPLVALGAKARKKWLRSCVAGTWLDPANDDETDGCGSREKSANARASRDLPRFDERPKRARTHACVAWVETRRAFCLTRPVAAEAALRYVRACTPKTSKKTSDDDERGTRNEEHRAGARRSRAAAVVANLARIESHSLTFDPFAGTGGLLAPAIALGAPFALGADVHVTSSNMTSSLPGREESEFGELGERRRDLVVANAHASPLKASKKSFIFRVIISTEPREYSRVLSWFAAVRRDRVRPAVRAARAENRERKRRRERRALFRRRRDGTRDERRVHAPGVFAD